MDTATLTLIDRACARAASRFSQQLSRRLDTLATVASTAPFFGLLGTCIGIINSFRGIAGEKSAYMAATFGYISEALLTTAISLVLAVLTYWVYQYLRQELEIFELEMSAARQILLAHLQRRSIPAK